MQLEKVSSSETGRVVGCRGLAKVCSFFVLNLESQGSHGHIVRIKHVIGSLGSVCEREDIVGPAGATLCDEESIVL